MSKIFAMSALAALALAGAAHAAPLAVINVNAADDIFAAGLANTAANQALLNALPGGGGNIPSYLSVTSGEKLYVTASGSIYCCDVSYRTYTGTSSGPNGMANPYSANPGSTITDSLGTGFGAFTDKSAAFPLTYVFTDGDGKVLASDNAPQKFGYAAGDSAYAYISAPTGAGRLYFGLADAGGFNGPAGDYADNSGEISVTISAAPEPASWALLIAGVAITGLALRGRRDGVDLAAA